MTHGRSINNSFSGNEPTVRVAETFPRNGSWTGNVNLGAMLLSGKSTQQSVLKLDEWWMPHVWTLSLWNRPSRAIPGDFPPEGQFLESTIARVDFGAGGATQSFEVDFVQGVMLSMPANTIQVALLSPATLAEIYAQVAIGTRGPSGTPHRSITQNLAILNATNSPVFRVPAFTDKIEVLPGKNSGAAIDSATITLEFSTVIGFTDIILSVSLQTITRYWGGLVTIPTGAAYVRITNASGADANLTLLSKLCF